MKTYEEHQASLSDYWRAQPLADQEACIRRAMAREQAVADYPDRNVVFFGGGGGDVEQQTGLVSLELVTLNRETVHTFYLPWADAQSAAYLILRLLTDAQVEELVQDRAAFNAKVARRMAEASPQH